MRAFLGANDGWLGRLDAAAVEKVVDFGVERREILRQTAFDAMARWCRGGP
jgi:hypothetical protein